MRTRLLIIGIIGVSVFGLIYTDSAHALPVPISLNVGQIQWLQQSHSPNGSVVVQVMDPDMNQNPNEIDKFKIDVWSDSDPDGISPVVYETGENTGVFESIIYFSAKLSTGQRLHTIEDDIAIAAYEDYTLPPPHTSDDKLKILDSIIIRKTFANPNENQNPFIRINDDSFTRQSLQTGETISASGTFTSLIVGSLGPILIVLFIVIYAVKKRMVKKSIEEKK